MHNYIFQAAPEIDVYMKSNVLPVAGDWPTWYFHKKIVCHDPEKDAIIPELGQFHVYLNGMEVFISNLHVR